uniref:Large ribosomal subunit protein bL32c n=1 Tax=Cryptomonas curvata TaxID=233186 RepID=A0A679C9R5_9CRYP|nr:ribosomal protein L32 [Cryptomonas curvata]
MAVPKKRTSKSKKNSRLANWTNKANIQAKRALSLAKSILSGNSTSFISNVTEDDNSKSS